MDQNFDNIPENQETQPVPDTADENQQKGTDQQYTDPNSGAGQTYQGNYYYDTGAGQTYQQQQQQPYQQQYQPYQQPGYDPGMDQTPLSMGEWILTILVMMIPCVGLIIYLVWAFGKNGNVNRRNYCRAYLIIYTVILVISIAFVTLFGAAVFSTVSYY